MHSLSIERIKRFFFTSSPQSLQQFMRRQVIGVCLFNLLLNWMIPYFGFDDLHAVYLFRGEHSFARFLLPMALLLPFFTTYDICKKTIRFIRQGKAGCRLPDHFSRRRFVFRLAAGNALTSFLTIAACSGLLQLLLPGHVFNGVWLSLVLSLLAALLSCGFALQTIRKLRQYCLCSRAMAE